MSQLRTSSIQHPSSSSANIVLAADGSVEIGALNGYRYAGTRYYTSSGQFEKADPLGTGDIGLRAIRVRIVGGGGGGGGVAATGGTQVAGACGGGGGAYAEKFFADISTLLSSETVTRGAAGTGGAAGNNTGTNGGTSSAFGLSATGGEGGRGQGAVTPPNFVQRQSDGGTASGGDINFPGHLGGVPSTSSRSVLSGNNGGYGAPSPLGGGGANARFDNQSPDSAASGSWGAGGAGGGSRASEPAKAGGNGADGVVIVDCYV